MSTSPLKPPSPISNTLNAKKRPSLSSEPSPQPTSSTISAQTYMSQISRKKPKHEHPLRQTSFPESSDSQSGLYPSTGITTPGGPPSETGSVAQSLLSGVSGKTGASGRRKDDDTKRARGRPKKNRGRPHDIQTGRRGNDGGDDNSNDYGDDDNDDGGSSVVTSSKQTNNARGTGRRGAGGGRAQRASAAAAAAAEEEDDNDPLVDPNNPNDSESLRLLHADLAAEKEKIAKLQDALTPEQMARYVIYTRTTLKKATLKRIINQTVSQSVAQNPLQAVQWVGKVFVGEIIEAARVVRDEWAHRWEQERNRRREQDNPTQTHEDGNETSHANTNNNTTTAAIDNKLPSPSPSLSLYPPNTNPHRAGLLPDHLREALRRYKAAGEGGGTGLAGYSHGNLAVKGEAVPRLGAGNGRGAGAGGRGLFR